MSGNANAVARALVARIESRNGDALRLGMASWIAVDKMRRDVAAARRVARGSEAQFDRGLDELVRRSPGLKRFGDWKGVIGARNALPAPAKPPVNAASVAMTGLTVAWLIVGIVAAGAPEVPSSRIGLACLALLPLSIAAFIRYDAGVWTPAAIAFLTAGVVHLFIVAWWSWRHPETE